MFSIIVKDTCVPSVHIWFYLKKNLTLLWNINIPVARMICIDNCNGIECERKYIWISFESRWLRSMFSIGSQFFVRKTCNISIDAVHYRRSIEEKEEWWKFTLIQINMHEKNPQCVKRKVKHFVVPIAIVPFIVLFNLSEIFGWEIWEILIWLWYNIITLFVGLRSD